MKILILGGTYFLGKAFVDIACEDNELTLINRGSRNADFPFPAHIRQIKSDRHDKDELKKQLTGEEFDVVVDFCAYKKGDIRDITEALSGKIGQYVFVSTADVYTRGTGKPVDENGEYETRDFGGLAGEYILGKAELEKELEEIHKEYGISINSVRPVFIYGPGNYANRESIFFQWIDKANQIIFPEDATGSFQLVFVEDVAKAILKICNDASLKDRVFNITGDGVVTYDSFADALMKATRADFERVNVNISSVNENNIPLPFPLTKDESETYTSLFSDNLGIEYTSLVEGLSKTYQFNREQNILPTVDELFDMNSAKDAEQYLIEMREEAKDFKNISMELTALNELIGYYRQTSEKDKLLSVINDSLSILEEAGETGTLRYATVALNVANAYRSLSQLDMAKKYYEITDSIYKNQIEKGCLLSDDLRVAGLYNNMSLMYQELSDYETAEKFLKDALNIVVLAKAGFETAVTYANLANTAVLAKAYKRAREYAYTAIRLFKARALKDAHYAASLSALATCYFEEKNYFQARAIFTEAAGIVESTIGKNSQYNRLCESIDRCNEMIEGDEGMSQMKNGMTLSKEYYEEFGKKMIHEKFPEYEGKIAVGLIGEGSDCFGFDDEISTDHDFGPAFCMWVSDDTYEAIGEKLTEEYENLPSEYKGYKRTDTSYGAGRRGVIRISDFYKKFLGTDVYEDINYSAIEDYSFAAVTNGEIFRDDEAIMSEMRAKLVTGYPDRIRMLKIAQEAAAFAQCAQYNYLRMLSREDEVTAQIMLSDGIKHMMKLYHHINRAYPPHDKWLYKSTVQIAQNLGDSELIILIDRVMAQFVTKTDKRDVSGAVENLAEYVVKHMYTMRIISDINTYLDYHTEELLFKASICELNEEELVKRIVKIEFEAFDKVKNEGGRAYCQNDWPTFNIMRSSQYLTWNKTMLIQYLYDFTREYNLGHNLITEKYGRMMESTDLEKWEEIKNNFPELTEEKKSVIEQIVAVQMQMMESFSAEHPKTAGNARTLHTYEDSIIDTSYETYLRGEISTYSDMMLQLYGEYVVNIFKNGGNIAHDIMENTAKLYGFESLELFEKA